MGKKYKPELVGRQVVSRDLAEYLQIKCDIKKREAYLIVDLLMEYIKDRILHGYNFTIPEVGEIGVAMTQHKYPRKCRNPKTGEEMMSREVLPSPFLYVVANRNFAMELKSMCNNGVVKFMSYIEDYLDSTSFEIDAADMVEVDYGDEEI